MIFQPKHSQSLLQGRLVAGGDGPAVIVDLAGTAFSLAEVAFAIPDDEDQANKIRAAGFHIQTPMSVHLGAGTTRG